MFLATPQFLLSVLPGGHVGQHPDQIPAARARWFYEHVLLQPPHISARISDSEFLAIRGGASAQLAVHELDHAPVVLWEARVYRRGVPGRAVGH